MVSILKSSVQARSKVGGTSLLGMKHKGCRQVRYLDAIGRSDWYSQGHVQVKSGKAQVAPTQEYWYQALGFPGSGGGPHIVLLYCLWASSDTRTVSGLRMQQFNPCPVLRTFTLQASCTPRDTRHGDMGGEHAHPCGRMLF